MWRAVALSLPGRYTAVNVAVATPARLQFSADSHRLRDIITTLQSLALKLSVDLLRWGARPCTTPQLVATLELVRFKQSYKGAFKEHG